ncbi:MAG: LytTR family transcriptional regulator DNA-binding domain-containing protein [Solobacterium sp.]|nr:LytTR family transcriptional regulator DNA-binding domain-containing protein [Solobacterium sp.]
MIAMLVADQMLSERRLILRNAKDQAAVQTDEFWKWIECDSAQSLQVLLDNDEKVDMICLDLTMKNALPLASEFRASAPNAYMILIADMGISPLAYMRPSIAAESLMLKPLSEQGVKAVLSEAIGAYAKRFLKPDEKKVFVLETKGGRNLIDYSRIMYFESREKKVFLNTGMEEYGFNDTLDRLETELEEGFIRCHRSFLVNKTMIESVWLSQNRLMLEDGIEIPLSRSYKPLIKEFIEGRREHGSSK